MNAIPVRTKLLLVTLLTILLLAIPCLVYFSASNRFRAENELLAIRSALMSETGAFHQAVLEGLNGGDPGQVSSCIRHAHEIESLLSALTGHESLQANAETQLKAGQARSSLFRLVKELEAAPGEDSLRRVRAGTEMAMLGGLINELNRLTVRPQEMIVSKNRVHLTITLIMGVFLIGTLMTLLSSYISRSLGKIVRFTGELKDGMIPLPLEIKTGDELGAIAEHLNAHGADLRAKIGHISSLAAEGARDIYKPGEFDELGNALVLLSDFLSRKELEEINRNREDKKQNWISEGFAQVGEVLRSERENVSELSYAVIQKLITYMNVEMGALYITTGTDTGNRVLELASSYAYDRRKYLKRTLEWGEELPGTCAQEKKRIFLTEVPGDYFEVSSGTGSAKPNCLLLVPMMIEQEVHGVLELATVRLLRPFEIEFAESLADSIASSLLAVQTNERTSELLRESRARAEALERDESAAREHLRQLEEAQAAHLKRESEIAGIIGAMNQSMLVAELGLNGRYTRVNDLFLELLGVQKEQILGKPHGDIARVDPYSDQYKTFWASLRNGERMSNVESYKLITGGVIWLKQFFTPLVNNEGRVHKILYIGTDITETRALQDQLESREAEITRGTLEMETLNKAVNSSLIKCELDDEGIIMDVNGNYTGATGYGRKELLGRNYRLFLKDTEKEQFEKIWNEVIKEKVYEGVIRRSKPTGEEVWLVSTFSPVIDEAGKIYKVYFLGLDITEKKLKYQLLEDANKEIDRLREQLKDHEN